LRWLHRLRADLLTSRGRFAEAAILYRESLELNPADDPALIVVLAECHRRGAVEEAIGYASRALQTDPADFMALKTLGWAYVTERNHDAARIAIEQALNRFDELKLGEPSTVLLAIGAFFGLAARYRDCVVVSRGLTHRRVSVRRQRRN
jgi:tetratricopeptide (TPR) repeat protein